MLRACSKRDKSLAPLAHLSLDWNWLPILRILRKIHLEKCLLWGISSNPGCNMRFLNENTRGTSKMFCTLQKPGKLTSSPEQAFQFYIQRSNFLNIDFISFFLRHFALTGSTDSSKYTEEKKWLTIAKAIVSTYTKLCLMHNVRDIKTAFQQQDDVLLKKLDMKVT